MIAWVIRWSANNLMLVLLGALFATGAGIYAVKNVPLDAIPDLSDTQVIIYTDAPGQAPQVVEDQITYPLTTAMLSVPKSRVVRGFSFFGVSFVYVIFEEGTDIYWARSRVLEYLSFAARNLPRNVTPTIGPDATGVGWVYEYVVTAAKRSLAELRTTQDWQIRYALAKSEGVAEVASVGGFVRQYSVVVDPGRLKTFDIPLNKIKDAIRVSNLDVGGRVIELAETEFMVRGRGYIRGIKDLEQIVLEVHGRDAGLSARRGPRRARSGRTARHHRAQRRGRGRGRYRRAALRAERTDRHRQYQKTLRGDQIEPARGHRDYSRLRPLRAHQTGNRDLEADAH